MMRPSVFHSLFFKTFLWFWLTLLATLGLLLFLSSLQFNTLSSELLEGPMRQNLSHFAKALERAATKEGQSIEQALNRSRMARHRSLYLVSEQRDKSFISRPLPPELDLTQLNFASGKEPQFIFTERFIAMGPFNVKTPDGDFELYEVRPEPNPPFFLRLKMMPTWLKLLIAVAASLALSIVFSRMLLKPLAGLKQATAKLAAGDLTARARVDNTSRDEIGLLGLDFNHMAERIEELLAGQKRLLADISHELRTPLTRLKLAAGLAHLKQNEETASYLERIEKEANQLDVMIADVLTLSRLEAKNQALDKHEYAFAGFLAPIMEDARFEARQQGKQLNCSGKIDASFKFDARLIASAIENILRNAIKYAEREIRVELSETSEYIELSICDDGPGVPQGMLDKLCEPFFRQSVSRERNSGGTGLGLAIAKQAINGHQGTLTLSNHENGGLCATIVLPLNK